MTLVGINWFAVAIAVSINMLYGHFYYKPSVDMYLLKVKEKNEIINDGESKKYLYLLLSSVAFAIAIWNLLANSQFPIFLIGIGIYLLFYVLPRFTSMAYGVGKQALIFCGTGQSLF